MGKYDKLKEDNQQITLGIKNDAKHFQEISTEYKRVAEIYSRPHIILNHIEQDFSNATQLNSLDVSFLFFATALQCIRQYYLTPFKLVDERLSDKEAARNAKSGRKTSNRSNRYYNPSLAEIDNNPVPFDANLQSDKLKGVLRGGGKFGHRLTLGHDPILGWVFGTANIATSTLTTWKMESYHVKTGMANKRNGILSSQDFISNKADTKKVFEYTKDKLINQGIEGKIIVARSIAKEWEHLKSDINSKRSLPFPIVSVFSPETANKLAEYGVDSCNLLTVSEQMSYSAMINFIIAVIHRMLYEETTGMSQTMYEVKTRKILSYSNLIASSSNIVAVAVAEAIALATSDEKLAKKGLKYFDIGGLIVTLYRLINDYNFIKEIKIEFMKNQWHDIILGDDYSFMKEEYK